MFLCQKIHSGSTSPEEEIHKQHLFFNTPTGTLCIGSSAGGENQKTGEPERALRQNTVPAENSFGHDKLSTHLTAHTTTCHTVEVLLHLTLR